MQANLVLHFTIGCITVFHCAHFHCRLLFSLNYIALQFDTMHWRINHSIALHCTALRHCTALHHCITGLNCSLADLTAHCTVLQCTAFWMCRPNPVSNCRLVFTSATEKNNQNAAVWIDLQYKLICKPGVTVLQRAM